jgi:hypothetical protein
MFEVTETKQLLKLGEIYLMGGVVGYKRRSRREGTQR